MAAIFEKFSKVGVVYSLDTLGVENFDEIALSLTVKEIQAILCFATFYLALKWPSLSSDLQTKVKIWTLCRHPSYALPQQM